MRVKPVPTFVLATGLGSMAYALKEKLMSFMPFFSNQNNQHQAPIPNKTLPLAALAKPTAPKIDINNDWRDLSTKHISLKDLQQLDTEVENNDFIGHVIWGTLPSGEEAHTLRTKIERKITKNNQNYQRYPSDFVHALFSAHAYQTTKEIGIPIIFEEEKDKYGQYESYLASWRVNSLHDLPDQGGYYGSSYYNQDARQLVLAHRGTPPALSTLLSSLFNKDSPYKTDIVGILKGEIVDQHMAAYYVTKTIANFAKENNYHFSTTGHSLGAWLAEISVYHSVFDFGISAKAVTFDSPGSINMESFQANIKNHENTCDIRDLDITTYLSDPNFINTTQRHVGQAYQLSNT